MTLSLVRDASGAYPLVYGTLVGPEGTVAHLDPQDFDITVSGQWTSSATKTVYPSGWRVRVPGRSIDVTLEPSLADQELDTRATTGVVYWEGSQRVTGTKDGQPIGGEAYVELTGYGRASTAGR